MANSLVEMEVDGILSDAAPLSEGVFDPYILKAVFLAGGGGSGKTFFGRGMFGGLGLKFVNSDDILEWKARKLGLNLANPKDMNSPAVQDDNFGIRAAAKRLTTIRQGLYVDGRLGLIIDGTGAKPEKIRSGKIYLESVGYDTSMVLVNTPLEQALKNNMARDRRVPEDVLRDDWNRVQAARADFRSWFRNYHEIEEGFVTMQDMIRRVIPKLTRIALDFVGKPVQNPIGKAWLKEMTAGLPKGTALGVGTGKVEGLAAFAVDQIIHEAEYLFGKGGRDIRTEAVQLRLPTSDRTRLNAEIDAITKGIQPSIPLSKIHQALRRRGYLLIDDDQTEWAGFLTGREGRANIDIGVLSTEQGGRYTPVSNSMLTLTWYKMNTGWETVAYIS